MSSIWFIFEAKISWPYKYEGTWSIGCQPIWWLPPSMLLRAPSIEANTLSGSSTNKNDPHRLGNVETTIHTMQTITTCGLHPNFLLSSCLTFISFPSSFFSMDHLLSLQAYVASASHYDECRAPTFFYAILHGSWGYKLKSSVGEGLSRLIYILLFTYRNMHANYTNVRCCIWC
jgi:hypothetical protein